MIKGIKYSIPANFAGSILRMALVSVLMLLCGLFSLRAQDNVSRVKVLFPFDSDVVVENYQGNAEALSVLNDAFAAQAAQEGLTITSYSSPEGNLAYNRNLSLRRAKSMQAYLEGKYPQLQGKITLRPGEEAWEDLRIQVESDSRLSESTRSAVLSIIGKDIEADAKERELTALPEYKRLYANYFKSLRFAAIELRIENFADSEKDFANSEISDASKSGGEFSAKESRTTYVKEGLPVVYYALNEDFIRPQYMGNDKSMKEIIRLLRSGKVGSMVIEGTASPEGPVKGNERLATNRAENLKNYIVGMFPEYENKITVVNKGAVEGAADDYPYLRSARIASIEVEEGTGIGQKATGAEESVVPATADTTVTAPADTASVAPADTTAVTEPKDTAAVVPVVPVVPVAPETVEDEGFVKKPLAALATNLLYLTGGSIATGFHAIPLTIGYEIPIGKHWSIHSNYLITSPWQAWGGNGECAELMHWDLGARWYPGTKFKKPFKPSGDTRVLEGWYAYLSAGMGYYDFQHNGNGYQGEEALGSVGIGYSLCFDEHWSLNFGLGVGPMYTYYRYYEGRQNNEHLMYRYSGNFTYFGVTDARVTLTYLFYYKKRIRK
ncbi:MAG: DUF3575 domain-containing protein [Bacteroidales bacterium]|nr:DUF3575 domain-containing protein [Bacteroidales bacterium]